MDILEAIRSRHSVRKYTNKKIEGNVEKALREVIAECNADGRLNIQLCLNEPKAFGGSMANYGKFENVTNYIALIGEKDSSLSERCGYFGEKIVLSAQQLGLNTCWVALTFSKSKGTFTIGKNEKLICVISIGYDTTNGSPRKTKTIEQLSQTDRAMPQWFKKGMEAVQLAPTAMNQQKFIFKLNGDTVTAHPLIGVYTKLDLGIVKYHFEICSGKSL